MNIKGKAHIMFIQIVNTVVNTDVNTDAVNV